ncbi:MAG: alpha/beta fold hydrolase [Clostridia bacterium]|nr:alpha/beta fold hydrolase [Clostridia bacterium]
MIFEKQIEKVFRSTLYRRCDDDGSTFYFSHKDFNGLQAQPYTFVSSMGNTLKGYFYSYENPNEDRLIVFDHGFGGGHRSYMKEIEMLCRQGYKVFSYDHTGCMESEGETTNGFAQSLHDLDDCISALKKDGTVNTADISVIGHSWGGFSTMNIAALHPDITHIVVISDFISVEEMVKQNFSGFLKGYRKYILGIEQQANPDYVGYNGVKTLSQTKAKVLLVYSADDALVKKEIHYDALKNALAEKENIEFLLEESKGHNPNYTREAVKLLGEYSAAKGKAVKKKLLQTKEQKEEFKNSFNWDKITEQDKKVWKKIFEVLAK